MIAGRKLAGVPHVLLAAALALQVGGADAQMGGKRGFKGGTHGAPGFAAGAVPGGAEGEGPDPGLIGAFFPGRSDAEAMRKRGFIATGLEAVYPAAAGCLPIVSPFASPTRHDGSTRNPRFFQGLHGGTDIAAPEGTPLLAVADGTVIHVHGDVSIGGIGIWMQHAPADTGFPVWVYSEYKHLMELPDLRVGQRVRMGDPVGKAGKTGTIGTRAYGAEGFSHLHWTTYYSEQPEYRIGRALIPFGGRWLDALSLFKGPPFDTQVLRDLPADEKKVPIAYKTSDGRTVPEGTKVVWPFACRPR